MPKEITPVFDNLNQAPPVIERVPLSSVERDPENSRKHNKRNLDSIRYSLRRFGQQTPIVVGSDGIIYKGNGTHTAAELEGWTHIDIVRSRLTSVELKAYAVTDNRAGELAEWDFESLSKTIREIKAIEESDNFNLENLGWAEYEVSPMLNATFKPPPVIDGPLGGQGGDDRAGVETGGHKSSEAISETEASDSPARISQDDLSFKSDLPPGCDASRVKPYIVTPDQRDVIDSAIFKARSSLGATEESMKDGRALELICADFLAGPGLDPADFDQSEQSFAQSLES